MPDRLNNPQPQPRVEELEQVALDAACKAVQDALGIKFGDFASLYWDAAKAKEFSQTFRPYIYAELRRGLINDGR